MNQKTFPESVLLFVFLFSSLLLHALNGTLTIKPLKPVYNWNEKVTVDFSGLTQREAYSVRVDDIIVVPAVRPMTNMAWAACLGFQI